MGFLKRAFSHEHKQFQKLSSGGQKFLLSIFLYNLINPIFAIFINAFIWRQSQDIMMVALFNLAWFSVIPLGFYLNGVLLKHHSVNRMYFLGAVLRSLLIALLIFFPVVNQFSIVLFGLGYGLASGIFFSNKNLLTVELTASSNRIYFQSLDFLSQTLTNIIIPLAIGSFIIFGTDLVLYTPQQAYYIVAILMILFSLLLGTVIKKISLKTPDVSNIILQHGSPQWNYARGIHFLMGLLSGITLFLPILIVLSYIGKEDTLGLVQSLAAVVSAVTLYTLATTINTKFRIPMIAGSIVLMILGSTILALYFNPLGIFAYFAIMTITHQVLIVECNSLVLDLIDRENNHYDHKYKYVFDLELVLNVGRVTAVMFFAFYMKMFSQDFAIQYISLFFSVTLLAIIILAKAIEDQKKLTIPEADVVESYSSNQSGHITPH